VLGDFMFYGRACAFWALAVVTLLTLPADGQSVISTRSGTVHFFEGAVYLGDQRLEYHPGKFSSVPEGGELRTAEGRAEVLLTPQVFIRIGDRSAIRMRANKLSDTRVELLAGSAVVDVSEPSSDTSVTLIYRNWSVRFLQQGVYRIDSDPPRLWVLQGKAEVSADPNQKPISVGQGMYLPFAPVLLTERSIDPPDDALSTWAEGRQQSISADNTIAANIQDPASLNISNSDPDSFTYFPMLGLTSLGSGLSSPYDSSVLYQPGFNSIYLPGYTYLPLFLGLGARGFPASLPSFPPHGLPSHPGVSSSRIPRAAPFPVGPVYPRLMPLPPVPAHPTIPVRSAPGGGIHGGVHSAPSGGAHVGVHR
jgi:hypothetical protein